MIARARISTNTMSSRETLMKELRLAQLHLEVVFYLPGLCPEAESAAHISLALA